MNLRSNLPVYWRADMDHGFLGVNCSRSHCIDGILVSGGSHFSTIFYFSPSFNQVGKLRTSSHLQLRPGQDKAKQLDTYNNTELHME
jgi:hypothetical protein